MTNYTHTTFDISEWSLAKVVLKSKCLSSSRFNRKGPLGLASVEIQMVIINNDRDKVSEEGFQQRGLLGGMKSKARGEWSR